MVARFATALPVALLLLVAWSSESRAEIESALVKKGIAAWADLDYAGAVALLEQARHESLTREEKIITYKTLGLAHLGLGQTAPARADFQRLLRIDPTFQLDRSVAPKVRAVFEEAKAQVAMSGRGLESSMPSVPAALSPPAPRQGRPLTVTVTFTGGLAQKMAIYHRRAGQTSFSRLLVDGHEGRFEATLPGMLVQPPALEYHIALLDDAGAAVASAGTLGQPLSVAVASEQRPLYKKGWFWGVIGGVAAAGAVAAAVAVALPRSNNATVTVNPQ